MDQLSLEDGLAARDQGIEQVADNNVDWLGIIRLQAEAICRVDGSVMVDQLRVWADVNNLQPRHQNAWGAVFKGPGWKEIGFAKSRYRSNHARRVVVWGRG